jgi:hypothetical protein
MDTASQPPVEGADSAPAELGSPGVASGHHGLVRRVTVLATAGILLVAIVVAAGLWMMRTPAGHVYFSTDPYDQQSGRCQFGVPIASTSPTRPFYMIAFFADALARGDDYSLAITRDGATYRDSGKLSADSKFQCYVEQDALGPLDPGVYRFTFTHGDKVEAEGSITIR